MLYSGQTRAASRESFRPSSAFRHDVVRQPICCALAHRPDRTRTRYAFHGNHVPIGYAAPGRRDSSAAIHDYRARSTDESLINSNAFACVSVSFSTTLRRSRRHVRRRRRGQTWRRHVRRRRRGQTWRRHVRRRRRGQTWRLPSGYGHASNAFGARGSLTRAPVQRIRRPYRGVTRTRRQPTARVRPPLQ